MKVRVAFRLTYSCREKLRESSDELMRNLRVAGQTRRKRAWMELMQVWEGWGTQGGGWQKATAAGALRGLCHEFLQCCALLCFASQVLSKIKAVRDLQARLKWVEEEERSGAACTQRGVFQERWGREGS